MTPLYTPANTIITFDLHDVLVQHDYKRMFSLWWQSPGRWIIMRHLIHPKFLWRVLRLRQRRVVAERLLIILLNEFPRLHACKNRAIAILNAQKLRPGSLELLDDLSHRGYTLHLFSNIGVELCSHLQNQLPSLFSYFKVIHVTKPLYQYQAKPSREAFEQYLSSHNQSKKQIIFIDNNYANISQAKQYSMIGILFSTIQQVRSDLNQLLTPTR